MVLRYDAIDHLGSTRAVVDGTGEAREAYDYFPYGRISRLFVETSGTDEKFTGKELENDFGERIFYFGARTYDGDLGRWNSRDPLSDKYLGWSSYNYVFNNPLKYIDPDGMDTLNINLPKNRGTEGTMTLVSNGKDVKLEGGNAVLGKGGSTDTNKKNGNSPTGEANATKVIETDWKGEFVNKDGTPVDQPGTLNKWVKAYGRHFIKLDPQSGDLKDFGREGIGIHGGGTRLGGKAINSKQKLVRTNDCYRVTNKTAVQIANRGQ